MGICSITSQVVLFRELFSILEGNEVIISLSMFLWLLFGGLGSLIAKKISVNLSLYIVLCLSSALLPPYLVFLSRYLYTKIFTFGAILSLKDSIFFVSLTIGLYALIIGILLPYSQKVISERIIKTDASKIYILDNLGDIIGAGLSTVLLLLAFKFQNLILISAFPIFFAALLLTLKQKKSLSAIFILAFIANYLALTMPFLDIKSLSCTYKDLIKYVDSLYGRIVVTKTADEVTVWESGFPYIVSKDITTAEEKAHYPLAQMDSLGKVLVISGYSPELIQEILKHNPKEIHYVELDPKVLSTATEFNLIQRTEKLNLTSMDAMRYVSHCKELYDAVIMDLPAPDTFQLARFYTIEYFSKIKKILTPKGVFSFSIEYSQNYMSRYQRQLLNVLVSTIKKIFAYYLIIPGEKLYILASNSPLELNIPKLLDNKDIISSYVRGYFEGTVTKDRIHDIISNLKDTIPNTELNSRAFRLVLEEWFYKASINLYFLYIILLVVLLLSIIFFSRTGEEVIFSSGFLLMGAEIIIIYLFQICHGYAYIALSAVIFSFLCGLLPGALSGNKIKSNPTKWVFICDILLSFMCLILVISIYMGNYSWASQVYLGYGFLLSFLVGMQFPLLTKQKEVNGDIPYKLFSADLVGAGLGVILVGSFTAPFFGIFWSAFSLLSLKALCIILRLWRV